MSLKPARKATSIRLCIDIRTRPEQDVQAKVFSNVGRASEIVSTSLKVKLAICRAMPTPVSVDSEDIEARRFDLLQDIDPELWYREVTNGLGGWQSHFFHPFQHRV